MPGWERCDTRKGKGGVRKLEARRTGVRYEGRPAEEQEEYRRAAEHTIERNSKIGTRTTMWQGSGPVEDRQSRTTGTKSRPETLWGQRGQMALRSR